MLAKAKNRKTVLIITLNPSLERNLVDIIDAIEPNKIAPTTDATISNGIVTIENSTVGPYVSIHKNTKIIHSEISNSIIGESTVVRNATISDSMIGNNCKYNGDYKSISIGDFSELI